ncbi:MAG: DNA recombination protein RmuC [Elusimicrobia bacterium]|nr:DNA recombination protein RmuC [Elusimicrobiota bacterium]
MNMIVVIAIVAAIAVFIFFNLKKTSSPDTNSSLLIQQEIDALRKQVSETLTGNTGLINQQIAALTEQVNKQLSSVANQLLNSQKTVGERIDSATKVVNDVNKSIGQLSEATKRVFEVGQDIASLQEILRAPKLRGIIGEFFLGDLLSQILPPKYYALQHQFKSGEKVDAIIHLGQKLVPVDSKFPLENFRKMIEISTEKEKSQARKKFAGDVKKHVDAISSKYILPDEGTFDFALMYIPAENVYYEMIIKDESGEQDSISTYALQKKVIPVSPNSFYAYLQAIVLGLRGMEIEEKAKKIMETLSRLTGDFGKFREDFEVLGGHIAKTSGKFDETAKKLEKFGDKLLSVEHHEKKVIGEGPK